MNITELSNRKTHEEYIYITFEEDITTELCHKNLLEINDLCLQHGYERVMINLSNLKVPISVATVYRAATSPEIIKLLPFRLAWVNDDNAWKTNWNSLELVMRNQSLPWRSFSDCESAELWLIRDRRELHRSNQAKPQTLLPYV